MRGPDGEPVADAEVDVWQADDDGFYDVQRPGLGRARGRAPCCAPTPRAGCASARVMPVAYPMPTDGPVGRDAAWPRGRHPWRPAHVHFMIQAPGYQTLITHVFRDGDPYLDSDVVFGVRTSLIGDFVSHHAGTGPHARESDRDFHTLDFDFVLAREAMPSTAD